MERQAIIKSSALLTLSGYLSGFLWYIFVLIAARWLGVEDFGKLTFALTFVALFRFTMDIGLSQLAQREIARDAGLVGAYFSNVMWLKLLLFFLSLCLIGILINILNYPPLVRKTVYILGIAEGLNSFSDFFRSIFRAYQKMHYEAIIWVMERFVVLSLCILVLNLGGGLLSVSLTVLLTSLLKFLTSMTVLLKNFLQGFQRPSLRFLINTTRKSILVGLIYILALFYFQIETVFLSLIAGDRAAGLYNASYKILEGAFVVQAAFFGVLYPLMSSLYKKDDARFKSVAQASMKYMLMVNLPLASFLSVMSSEIVTLLYGPSYIDGAFSLRLIIWTTVLHSILTIQYSSLLAMGEEKRLIFVFLLTGFLNIVLNLLLIPTFKEVGAAIIVLISEFSVIVLSHHLLSSLKVNIPIPSSAFSLVLIVSTLTIFNVLIKGMPFLAVIPLMSALYLLAFITFGLLSINDIKGLILSGYGGHRYPNST